MWLFQPHRLCIFAGICIFILVVLTEGADARGMSRTSGKRDQKPSKLNSRLKPGKKGQKKGQKKDKKRSQNVSKKENKKQDKDNAAPRGGKTNVNLCPIGSEEVQMNCLSCATKIYRECPVTSATKITQVNVVTEYKDSYDTCSPGRKNNYGIKGNSVWVDRGCRAKFQICYEKGRHEPKNVNCMCTSSKHKCPVGIPQIDINIHIKVSVLWSFGSGKCKEGQTWGYDDHDIWVDKGCSATFHVLW